LLIPVSLATVQSVARLHRARGYGRRCSRQRHPQRQLHQTL